MLGASVFQLSPRSGDRRHAYCFAGRHAALARRRGRLQGHLRSGHCCVPPSWPSTAAAHKRGQPLRGVRRGLREQQHHGGDHGGERVPPPAQKVGEAALLALAAEQTNPPVLVVVYAGRASALTSLATTVSVCYPRVWTQLTTFFGAASVVDPDYGLPTLDQLSDQLAVAYGTELRRNRFTAFHRAHVRPCLDHSVGYPAVAYGLIKAMNNRRTYPKIAVSPEGLPERGHDRGPPAPLLVERGLQRDARPCGQNQGDRAR